MQINIKVNEKQNTEILFEDIIYDLLLQWRMETPSEGWSTKHFKATKLQKQHKMSKNVASLTNKTAIVSRNILRRTFTHVDVDYETLFVCCV
ncbi:CLUMA_CG008182, isoform A [Clunio marinus]|uniref:CLUMA_CG008182, isoform A n=1 Tax=Clunio marinus TaxID=568069 RepID=A0A1J1I4J6_9DIPT|nr:CLUMA_CG008182, isoform A [Clunio marinus]